MEEGPFGLLTYSKLPPLEVTTKNGVLFFSMFLYFFHKHELINHITISN